MLKIGDKVSYPMHGAGIIVGTEECEVLGETKTYYVLKLPMGNMKVMIPMDGIEKIGLRDIMTEETLREVLAVWTDKPDRVTGSWNKRFQTNLARMKSGNLCDVAAVARNLAAQDKIRRISSGERRLLDLSKQILVSEMVYALGKEPEDVEIFLAEQLASKRKRKSPNGDKPDCSLQKENNTMVGEDGKD